MTPASMSALLLTMLAAAAATLQYGGAAVAAAAAKAYPCSAGPLEYYVHALGASTAYVGKDAPSQAFGTLTVFHYNISAAPEPDVTAYGNQQLGSVRGLEAFDSVDPTANTILVLNSVTYDDGVYNGTVNLHGQANINETSYEIAVVGGTGSFRRVSGYAAITNLRTPGNDHVFRHTLHFSNTHCS